ncbi:EpsG family protein [Providencia sp. PROV036]|uniref:EpsG family protein n=1 Tax=Providencia sp. PROV036 TaxID=2949767 RepID=UPI00234A071F|nr:EpsG family protein [Providencia sp. PROV036]
MKKLHLYNNNKIAYTLIILTISFLYAFSLVYFFPMESITDRENYLVYASNSDLIQNRYLSRGILSFFTNEPLWLTINTFLSYFFSPTYVVSLIIFLSAFISAYLILQYKPKFIVFLFIILFFPPVIGKYIAHLRQGLAISIFLIGWFSASKNWRLFFFVLTPFIHASFFFVLLLLIISHFLNRIKFAIDLKIVAIIIFGLALGLGLGYITTIIGARQAEEYKFSAENISGLGFVFWLSILLLYLNQGRFFSSKNTFAIVTIVFYLSTYFLIEVTARIFESTMIIVLLSSLDLTSWRRNICFLLIISFELINWFIRFNKPWFGWG